MIDFSNIGDETCIIFDLSADVEYEITGDNLTEEMQAETISEEKFIDIIEVWHLGNKVEYAEEEEEKLKKLILDNITIE